MYYYPDASTGSTMTTPTIDSTATEKSSNKENGKHIIAIPGKGTRNDFIHICDWLHI